MDNQQAKGMLGTEFKYVFESGNSVKCYIKAYDPKVGLTCMAFTSLTENGTYLAHEQEPDGSICIMGYNFEYSGVHKLRRAFRDLEEIKRTGKLVQPASAGGAQCAF